MSMELTSITVPRYRDAEGKPTCATNFEKLEVCIFWRCKNFGTRELCGFAGEVPVFRRGPAMLGTMIPTCDCPLWKDEPR